MHRSTTLLAASLTLALTIVGCGGDVGSAGVPSTAPDGEGPGAPTVAPASPTPPDGTNRRSASPAVGAAEALAAKAWATVPLVDVRTGETFRIADLAGRVVFVETMAIWCTNCRFQQEEAATAMAALDPERVVWLALDVEPTESAPDLARYADRLGFPHRYAIAPPDLARALAAEFGDGVLSPPSVPIVEIAADGGVEGTFGHRSSEDVVATAIANGA